MADVFISYAREDREQVGRLAAQLEEAGLTCWWDRQLSAGEKFIARTEAELNAARVVLVVWSQYAVTSHWVIDEAGVGRESGRLVPVSLDESLPPLGFRQFQTLDFSPWRSGSKAPLKELVAAIARIAPAKPPETPASPSADPAATAPPSTAGRRFKPTRTHFMLAAAALVVLLGALAFWPRGDRASNLETSIAILPFANASGDPGKDYLAHGIASELIETLSQLDKLQVVGRGSSFTFGADADPRVAGKALGVANVLSGSVGQEGDRLRISIELVNTEDGRTILSKTYTQEFTTNNVATAQRYIAEQVAGVLSIAFNIKTRQQIVESGTRSLEAYDFYLRGLEEWGNVSEKAEDLFAHAVAIDPNYAAAWALRAITHAATSWSDTTPALARAKQDAAYAMAQKAVTLDGNNASAQAVFANLAGTQHKWVEAEIASLRAMDLAHNEVTVVQRQLILLRAGRVAEADALAGEVNRLTPRNVQDVVAAALPAALGRNDELRNVMERPEWTQSISLRRLRFRLESMVHLRDAQAVRRELQALADQPDRAVSEFAKAVLAVADDKAKARSVLHAWYDGQGFETAAKYELIPILAAWYDDTDLVLRVWRDDLPIANMRMALIWGPAFAPARARPEFKTLMQDVGLVEYWRTYKWADKCRPVGASDFECG